MHTIKHFIFFLDIHCTYYRCTCLSGPSLFFSCPMDFKAAEGWFVNVWNYNVIPYLHQALRSGRKVLYSLLYLSLCEIVFAAKKIKTFRKVLRVIIQLRFVEYKYHPDRREIRPHGHNNLACWIINLFWHALLCSIAENLYSLFVIWLALRAHQNTAQLVKILSDTTQQNV